MSVTFSVESPIIGWVSACACGLVRTTTMYETYDAVRAAIDAGAENPQCWSCDGYGDGPYASAISLFDEAPEVNVSNANAGTLLRALGLYEQGGDLTGALPGEEFASKVIQARVLTPQDAGVPATQYGLVTDCGRRPGYVQDRLDELQEIANFAWDKGLAVVWG